MDPEINPTHTPQGPKGTSAEILLRRENSTTNQKALKEKFVVVYEALFNGEDPSVGNPNFWDEVLLLKVNSAFLDRCIILTAEDKLMSLKNNISMIFIECAKAITDPFPVRKQHAIETLTILMRSIFRKKFTDFGEEVTNILCGSMERADIVFTDLLRSIQVLLDAPDQSTTSEAGATSSLPNTYTSVINLLMVIVTAVDNINQNTLYEYFLKVDLFPTFTKAIVEGRLTTEQAFQIVTLIVVLANYQKNEANNVYLNHLKHMDDPTLLKAFANILSEIWNSVNKDYTLAAPQDNNAGMWYKFGSYVSSFIYKQPEPTSSGYNVGPCLLVLYELVYLNSHFVKSLIPARVPSSPRVPSHSPRASNPTPVDPLSHPSGKSVGVPLIQQFLAFCTHIFSDCSDTRTHTYAKLCLVVLTCMSENSQLEEFFHDPASAGSFTYSKVTGPADKAVVSNAQPQAGQGLACVVLDALNLFMKQNMKKKFDLDLYRRCIGVVHRVLSYEKRTSTRLAYKWKDMWNTLFIVMKQSIGAPGDVGIVGTGTNAIASNAAGGATATNTGNTPAATDGNQLLSKQQLGICLQVVTVLNLFITYGDSFLPSPSDYDDLYYEIMRVSKMLDHFYTMAEKQEHATFVPPIIMPQPTNPDSANVSNNTDSVPLPRTSTEITSALATLSMLNIKTIITHFSGKVQQWNFAHPEVALTPDVVLRIIKDNYDTLKLKLQENLDFYEEYVETTETPFFRHLTRTVIQDIKTSRSSS